MIAANEPGDGARPPAGHAPANRVFDDASRGLDRFALLLVLTIGSVVLLSLVDLESVEGDVVRGVISLVMSLMIGVTFVLALRASGVAQRWRRFAEALAVVAVAVSVIGLINGLATDSDGDRFVQHQPGVLWVLIAVLTPMAIIRRLLRHRRVAAQTLAGAIAAYLLIALAGCYVFLTLDTVIDDGFFGGGTSPTPDFMYFSLVTVTTLGFGDLSPVEPSARLAATSLAVIGQIYLVTFVAMLVGLLIQQRPNEQPAPPPSGPSAESNGGAVGDDLR
ncbi:MAG: potassium channel family protein [Actinomycetota bacterium]